MPSSRREALRLAALSAVGLGLSGCAPSMQARSVTAPRLFGVAMDPWRVNDWATVVGARPSMVMEFVQWSSGQTFENHFAAARTSGMKAFMVTWEPWKSTAANLGKEVQILEQPLYSNHRIAGGRQDAYVSAFARSVAGCGLPVYLRFGHEANGDWYPWSNDPPNFIQAW